MKQANPPFMITLPFTFITIHVLNHSCKHVYLPTTYYMQPNLNTKKSFELYYVLVWFVLHIVSVITTILFPYKDPQM